MNATIRCVICLLLTCVGTAFAADTHWAFQPIDRPAVPFTKGFPSARNPVDFYIHAKLRNHELRPSPAAERHQLIRRLTLDLIGLPPNSDEVREFVHDDSPEAYHRLVERLLASPHYGEAMAVNWMDAARYGDSGAMHADRERAVWAWRDYVIDAFNANKPFDEFTVEQIAGDLLPEATFEQKVASAFNRHHPTSDENGSIEEELRVEYVADRVHTTATVWLGLTMDCARCHDHPYDPISQRDYYRFFAYFNNGADPGIQTGQTQPNIRTLTRAERTRLPILHDRVSELSAKVRDYKDRHSHRADEFWKRVHERRFELATPPADLEQRLAFPGPGLACEPNTTETFAARGILDSTKPLTIHLQVKLHGRSDGMLLSRVADDESRRGFTVSLHDGKLVFRLIRDWPRNLVEVVSAKHLPENRWTTLTLAYPASRNRGDCRLFVNGKPAPIRVAANSLIGEFTSTNALTVGANSFAGAPRVTLAEARVYSRALNKMEIMQLTPDFRVALSQTPEARTRLQRTLLAGLFYRRFDPNIRDEVTELDRLYERIDGILVNADYCLVMAEQSKRRPTYMLDRGDYQSPRREQLLPPGVPVPLDFTDSSPPDRLGLARWLVHSRNPLTARVTVNWVWQKFFGRGLVDTPADFGRRGSRPSHPRLLDWLADEFIASDWNLRHLIRLIVHSHTYRQSARHRPQDGVGNIWLARAPRLRLPAETIRDQALTVSGLLVERFEGRSVKPYQPPRIWSEVHLFPDIYYRTDGGSALYRRSVYTYWHRSAPLPNMMIFDAPSRERCAMKRTRTNTPLQALVTLNDEQFVEAARSFAQFILSRDDSTEDQLRIAFRQATARTPSPTELRLLRDLLADQIKTYRQAPDSATKLLQVGDSEIPDNLEQPLLAAWTVVCQLLLNLDEVLHRN